MYIIVRLDLTIGQQMAQLVHANTEYILNNLSDSTDWYNNSNYVVCLNVKDEEQLSFLSSKLEASGINHSRFTEPDLNNSLTSISFIGNSDVKKFISSLPLAGKEAICQK